MKKRMLSLLLIAALCLGLAACAKKDSGTTPDADPGVTEPADPTDAPEPSRDPVQPEGGQTSDDGRSEFWAYAINAARDDELNGAFPVMTPDSEADPTNVEMTFALLGFAPEDVESYAISLSLMNVNAYAIVAVMPAEGKAETVKEGLENYIEGQKASFEHYLEDQFEIASNAKLETMDGGGLLLVMCEGQDAMVETLQTTMNAKA